jgi:hypothetical protein
MTDASSITQLGLFPAQTAGDAVLFGRLTGKALGDFVLAPVDPVKRHRVRGVAACA